MTSESEEEDTEEEVKLEEKADDQGVEGPAPAAGEIAPEASRDKNKEKDKKAKSSDKKESEKKSKEKKAERSPSHRKSKKASRSRSHKKSKEKKAARSRSHRDRGRRRSRRQESGRDRATDRTGTKEDDQAIGRLPSLTNLPKCLELPLAQPRKGKARRGNPNGGFVEIVGVEQPHMNPLWSNIVGATNSVSRGSAGISSQKFSRRRPRGKPAASMLNVCDSRVAQTRPKLLQQIAALPHRQLPPPRAVVRSRLLRCHRLLLRATLRRRR